MLPVPSRNFPSASNSVQSSTSFTTYFSASNFKMSSLFSALLLRAYMGNTDTIPDGEVLNQLLGNIASGLTGSLVSSITITLILFERSTFTMLSNSFTAALCTDLSSLSGLDWKKLLAAVSALKPKDAGRIINMESVTCIYQLIDLFC